MTKLTIDDIGEMILNESDRTAARFDEMEEKMETRFDAVDTRFDRLEKRVMNVEEFTEEARGRFISIEDRLSKIEYSLDGASPRQLKKRTEKLEKKVFGSVQAA